MIKNIVFDMGGVIVDLYRQRAIEQFQALGVSDAGELIGASHHNGIFIDYENGDIDTDEFCALLCRRAGKDIPRPAIEDAWKSIIAPPPEYKMEYIRELKKKYKLFILTNNNPVIMGWARSEGFTSSGDLLSDCFDGIYTSYEMKCSKPDLKIFRMLVEDAGIDPAETLYIDDSAHNLVPAQQLGMFTLLVENASDWRDTLNEKLKLYCLH